MSDPGAENKHDHASLFSKRCIDCLIDKANNSTDDTEKKNAENALLFIACISEFMACRMMSGTPRDECETRTVKKIPAEILKKIQLSDCSSLLATATSTKYDLSVSGLVHAIIEDEDWDRR